MRKLRYLITGTGRCGTVFMARLLTTLGIPCGHEAVFDWHGHGYAERRLRGKESLRCSHASCAKFVDGVWYDEPEWVNVDEIVAESSYMAAPFLNSPSLTGVPVIHVVRNPIKVINSFSNYLGYFKSEKSTNRYEQFIYLHLPELQEAMPHYDRAALFYILWNELIESKASLFHRIEDDPQPVLDFLGVTGAHFSDATVNTQARPGKRFMFRDILRPDIAERLSDKCEEYGYPRPDSNKLLLR